MPRICAFDYDLLRKPPSKRILLQQRRVVRVVHESNRLPVIWIHTNERRRLFRLGE